MLDVYRVSVDGGTPMPVAADRYTTEYFAAPAPAGEAVAITARANAGAQWWRKGHSHLDESEIWIVRPGGAGGPRYEQITRGGAKDAWPMWAAGGKGLYFMSDRSGAQNIWSVSSLGGSGFRGAGFRREGGHDVQGRARAVAVNLPGTAGRSRSSATSGSGRSTPQADSRTQVPITLRGAPAATGIEHRTFSDQLQELALSPDGKKGGLHGARRGVLGLRQGRRRRRPRDADRRRGERDRLGAQQPAARLRVGPERREPAVRLRLRHRQGDADHQRRRTRRRTALLARTGNGSRSSATRGSCA